MPKLKTPPKQPGRKYLHALSCDLCDEIEVWRTHATDSWLSSQLASLFAFSLVALARSESVSRPWSSMKALKGDWQAPQSRRVLTRARRIKRVLVAFVPKTGCLAKSPPWYEACGSAI